MSAISVASSCTGFLVVLALAGCGNKPDGTPYGVNPAKHPDGHLLTDRARGSTYTTGTGMPKGAEMNAVTGGAKTGQPTQQLAQDAPAQ